MYLYDIKFCPKLSSRNDFFYKNYQLTWYICTFVLHMLHVSKTLINEHHTSWRNNGLVHTYCMYLVLSTKSGHCIIFQTQYHYANVKFYPVSIESYQNFAFYDFLEMFLKWSDFEEIQLIHISEACILFVQKGLSTYHIGSIGRRTGCLLTLGAM